MDSKTGPRNGACMQQIYGRVRLNHSAVGAFVLLRGPSVLVALNAFPVKYAERAQRSRYKSCQGIGVAYSTWTLSVSLK